MRLPVCCNFVFSSFTYCHTSPSTLISPVPRPVFGYLSPALRHKALSPGSAFHKHPPLELKIISSQHHLLSLFFLLAEKAKYSLLV
jgi:hypothetical protein